jgi:hypothetical protein
MRLPSIAMFGLLLGAANPSQAGIIVTLEQVKECGALPPCHYHVVVSAEGTLNLTDLTPFDESLPVVAGAEILPFAAKIVVGTLPPQYLPVDEYISPLVIGPSDFGPAYGGGHAFTVPSSGTGDRFGILGDSTSSLGNLIIVPDGYVSGDPWSATSLYNHESFKTIGVTPGTYVWTWGTGLNADSFTVEVTPFPVPEPVSLSLLGVGLAGLGVRRWRRAQAPARGHLFDEGRIRRQTFTTRVGILHSE